MADEASLGNERLIHLIVFTGQVFSGKSTLVKKLTGCHTNVHDYPDSNDSCSFEFYQEVGLEDPINLRYYVDCSGFEVSNPSMELEDTLNYINDLPDRIENAFNETEMPKIQEKKGLNSIRAKFIFTYVIMSSDGNIKREHCIMINHLIRNNRDSWFYVMSKYDERWQNVDDDSLKIEVKKKACDKMLEMFTRFNGEDFYSRIFFISSKAEFIDNSYNDFSRLRDALKFDFVNELQPRVFFNYKNAVVVGAGNIGKSSLINFLIGRNVAQVYEGPMTKELTPYDHPDYCFVKYYDSPGYDGVDCNTSLSHISTHFDLIILLVKDFPVTEDVILIKNVITLSRFSYNPALFIVKTYFDTNGPYNSGRDSVEQAKERFRASILRSSKLMNRITE